MMRTSTRLINFLRQPWRLVVLAVALGWATTICWFALISTSAYLISYAALQPSIAELQVAIVGVRFFGIARAVFRYLERLVSHTVTFKLLAGLRVWFYERIEPLAPAGLESETSGDLFSRIVSDVETLQDFYVRTIAPPIVALLSSLGVLWFFGRWSPSYALIILVFQLLTGVVLPLVVRWLGKTTGAGLVNVRSRMSALVVDSVQGSAEVMVFGQKERFEGHMNELIRDERSLEANQNRISSGHAAVTVLFVNLTAVVLLIAAVPAVRSGDLDGRLLAVVILGAIASFEAILPLPLAFQNLDASLAAGERLFNLADKKPVVQEVDPSVRIDELHSLEFEDLSFAYRHDEGSVLSNISLEVPPGRKVAILGPSGVGKSTIASLLLRFREPTGGRILVNGGDIQSISPEDIRRLISYVPQNPFLFNTSIEENIRIGNPSADREEVFRAARMAGLDEFIRSLPEQYATPVGEFGVLLSGGQRQRLALARALLRETPLYLFDEPTANLDSVTEKGVIDSILQLVEGKSLIWITHRLEGLGEMDEIVVLANREIAERGTHQELIQAGGRYARMVQMQHEALEL